METPAVSVIIPVYNVEAFLPECLDSVVNQLLSDIEIITVNDVTPDNSQTVINRYAHLDGRFIQLRHEVNKGLGEARNTGVRHARGEYVYFLDSDDYLVDEYALQALYDIASANNDDIVFGKAVSKYPVDGKHILCELRGINIANYPYLVYNHSAWNKLLRREFLLENEFFFKPPRYAEDIIFSIRTNLRAKSISITNRPTYFYRWGRQVTHANKQKIYDARENLMEALAIVEADGRRFVLEEMRRKTIKNAYGNLVRAEKVLDRNELHNHFKKWKGVFDAMPDDIFGTVPNKYETFCRLIQDERYDDALKFWKKTKSRKEMSDISPGEAYHRLRNMYASPVWRASAPLRWILKRIHVI